MLIIYIYTVAKYIEGIERRKTDKDTDLINGKVRVAPLETVPSGNYQTLLLRVQQRSNIRCKSYR